MDNSMLNWPNADPQDAPPSGGRRRRRIGIGAGLVAGGAIVGGVLAGTMSAGAATPSTAASTGSSAAASSGSASAPAVDGRHDGGHGLDLTGTVTTVGASSVTIKTSSGSTVTYSVNSASDIDKNGEAQLSSLTAGDAVRYSLTTDSKTIDKLHAGDEAKDMPSMPSGPTG